MTNGLVRQGVEHFRLESVPGLRVPVIFWTGYKLQGSAVIEDRTLSF